MTIELPDQELENLRLTSEEAHIEIACGLYAARKVSMGRAAKIAGISYTDFMHELGRRGRIPACAYSAAASATPSGIA